jgi:type I site-specific restriction endonuclease
MITPTAPTVSGWSVIEHAPPGPVALTEKQREEVRQHATARAYNCPQCGYWATTNDDARVLEAQRDEARAEAKTFEAMWRGLLETLPAQRDEARKERDTARARLAECVKHNKALSSSPDAARRYAERVERLEKVAEAARAWLTVRHNDDDFKEYGDIVMSLATLDAEEPKP